MSSLRDDLRRLADAFEDTAQPEAAVVARIGARQRNRRILVPAMTAVGAVAVLFVGVSIRGLLTSPDPGPPVMPATIGLFRSLEPDKDGTCFAVRLYDTTAADGRVAAWAWTGVDGCASRSSNLLASTGRATAVWLPALKNVQSRAGIQVEAPIGTTGTTGPAGSALGTELRFVLDPAFDGAVEAIPGFWTLAEVGGDHTVEFQPVDNLDVPYVVP